MSEYYVRSYEPRYLEAWDDFVERSNNGTIFHRQDFLFYHPPHKFQRDDKMIYEKDRLVALLPLSYETANNRKVGRSPYGGSYGGLVAGRMSSHAAYALALAVHQSLQREGYAEWSLCFPPDCYYREYDCNVEYLLLKTAPVKLEDRGLTSVIELGERYLPCAHFVRNLKKATAYGVEVKLTDDVDDFYSILTETLVVKHGGRITHTLEELKYLKRTLGARVKIFIGVHGARPVSGVLVFENASPCATAFYNCHLADAAHLCSLNKVYDEIVKHYRGGYHRWLDLGQTDTFSTDYRWGLFRFKEATGARGFYRNYYRILYS